MADQREYFDTAKTVINEPAAGGKKNVWVELAEGYAVKLKLNGNAKKADIDAAAAAALADHKDRRAKEIELEELEAAAAELRAELGIE